MRLSPQQISSIRSGVQHELGDDARVYLYGSRTDDAKRGGDVDLLIEANAPVDQLVRARIKLELERTLNLPVDVLFANGASTSAFVGIARSQAIALQGGKP